MSAYSTVDPSVIAKKICLVGDFGVGKTSLIKYLVNHQFSDQYLSTVGVKISRRLIEVSINNNQPRKKLQLLIWDLEGKTKFKPIVSQYLLGAEGAIIVADLTRQETIDNLQEYIQLFSSVNPKASAIIVAFNKCDLFTKDECEKFSKPSFYSNFPKVKAIYLTSAKIGKNVEQLFYELGKYILKEL